ncbi:MAG: redoxin domain-containing protein [Robiginitalea sp.]
MVRFLLLLILSGVIGCTENQEQGNPAFFAGEIVNPTDSLVILFKGEQPIDSARLDNQNRFSFTLDSLQSGLYNFRHKPEFQYVYLEEGDSLQIRLNTFAFDESLVFSGTSEGINNFLIDFFLEAEAEQGFIREYLIPMEPQVFSSKLDSIKMRKLKDLDDLRIEFLISDKAYHTAHASILYQHYLYREKYPFWHRKITGDGSLHELPDDFYAYRDEISYDDPTLTFLKPYHDFMIYHIGNLAYMGCRGVCEIRDDKVLNQLHFNRHQLNLIDSLVTGEALRDNLFRTVAFDYLLKYDSNENLEAFMEDFHRLSENNRHSKEIEGLSQAIQKLRPDQDLPDLQVENSEGNIISLKEIGAEGPVVFYFWSGPQQHHLSNITRRVYNLRENYQGYRFIGICLQTEKNRWKSMLKTYSLDTKDQFWASDFEKFSHTLVVYDPYKSILCRDGKIVDGFANLHTSF